MNNTEPKHTYTFVNPNTPKEFKQILMHIMIDKLLSSQILLRKCTN